MNHSIKYYVLWTIVLFGPLLMFMSGIVWTIVYGPHHVGNILEWTQQAYAHAIDYPDGTIDFLWKSGFIVSIVTLFLVFGFGE